MLVSLWYYPRRDIDPTDGDAGVSPTNTAFTKDRSMTIPASDRTALGREALETGAATRAFLAKNAEALADLGRRMARTAPRGIVTCARGSSDHASNYGKFLIETRLGHPVASVGMSVASVYNRDLDLKDMLFVTVSQSGRSPDLLRLTESAKRSGALVVGFVNDETSPLMQLCDIGLPLSAGPEKSVAATKSFLVSCAAYLGLVAAWTGDAALTKALHALPDAFDAAAELDWRPQIEGLKDERDLLIVGRGPGFGPALEAALKCKETSSLHAEAFSAAEVIHGPLGLVVPGFPALAFGQEDEAAPALRETIARFVGLKGRVMSALPAPGVELLPTVAGVDPVVAPLCQLLSFYIAVQHLALARGLDPDQPTNLRKVTETR
jgi:glutamine---fructose-6-phosphate transaminase (isomerizing)